jgi:hypothetical protein
MHIISTKTLNNFLMTKLDHYNNLKKRTKSSDKMLVSKVRTPNFIKYLAKIRVRYISIRFLIILFHIIFHRKQLVIYNIAI